MKIRKLIVSIFVLIFVLVLASGCATTTPPIESATESRAEIETEPASSVSKAESESAIQSAIEGLLINSLGADNVEFLTTEDGNGYCIFSYVDFSYGTFMSDDSSEIRNGIIRDTNDTCANIHRQLSYDNVHFVIYSRIDGVVYASTNGVDNTYMWLIAEAG